MKQPLLRAKRGDKDNYLIIPELCVLTALTDGAVRADCRIRKAKGQCEATSDAVKVRALLVIFQLVNRWCCESTQG